MFRIAVLCAAVSAAAAGHGHPRVSLLGENTMDALRTSRSLARAALSAAPAAAPAATAGSVRLTAHVPSEHAPPSGLVDVIVSWSAPWSPVEDVITLSCGGASPSWDVADYFAVPAGAASGSRTLQLPHGTGCAFALAYEAGGGALFGRGDASGWRGRAAAAAVPPLGADTDAVGTRLALGDSAGDVLLTWGSLNGSAPAYVRVGTTRGGPYTQVFRATSPPRTYAAADMCHAPASEPSPAGFVFPGYFHTVALNLTEGARFFAVYGQEGGVEAPETTFRTWRAPGPDVPARFAAFGDAATYFIYPGTVTTVDDIAALDAALDDDGGIDFVTNIGDLAYAGLYRADEEEKNVRREKCAWARIMHATPRPFFLTQRGLCCSGLSGRACCGR